MTVFRYYDVLCLIGQPERSNTAYYIVLSAKVQPGQNVVDAANKVVDDCKERTNLAGLRLQRVKVGPPGSFDQYLGAAVGLTAEMLNDD
jgi:hypothetical protein